MSNRRSFHIDPPFIRLSDAACRLRIGEVARSALVSYSIDSVKVDKIYQGIRSTSIVRIKDVAGEATVFFRGDLVAILLGIPLNQWRDIEKLSSRGQLFYRPFKNGLNTDFPVEQRLFYSYCESLSTREVFFITYKRVANHRRNEENVPFLEVLDCSLATPKLLKLYNYGDIK